MPTKRNKKATPAKSVFNENVWPMDGWLVVEGDLKRGRGRPAKVARHVMLAASIALLGCRTDRQPPESGARDTVAVLESKSPPTHPDSLPTFARLRDLIASCGSRWGQCAWAIGHSQLALAGERARKDSSSLSVRLLNGSFVTLGPDTSDWRADYQLYAWFPRERFYLVHLQYAEGDGYAIVAESTGAIQYLDDLPHFSPGETRFAVASGDLEANYNPTSLSVWAFSRDSLLRLWEWRDSTEEAGWVAAALTWHGDTAISFIAVSMRRKSNGMEVLDSVPSGLRLIDGRWTLTGPSP